MGKRGIVSTTPPDLPVLARVEAMKDLEEEGIATLKLDVTSATDIKSVVDKILATTGHIDLLVCNAGNVNELDTADTCRSKTSEPAKWKPQPIYWSTSSKLALKSF